MTYQGQTGTTSTGTEPAYVPDREVFDAYTHQQIWDLARERLAPAELRRVADAWGRTADALESAFDEHARELNRLSGEWSGIAAGAATQAAAALVQAADGTVEVCRALRHLMTANSDAAESLRAAIPPPPEPYRPDPDAAVEAATGAQRRTAHNLATAAATAAAQDAMTFGYNPAIPASGDSVPRFPAVVATAPESTGTAPVPERGSAPAPSSGPGTAVGADPESPDNDSPGSTTSQIDGDTAPLTLPGRVADGPQPSPGNPPAPAPSAPENESQPAGIPADPSPEPGSPAESPVSQGASPQPDNPPGPGSPQPPDTPTADTSPAAASAPDTRHARSEPAVQPSSAPADRGTGPATGPGVTDLSPRSPASPPTTGPTAPIPPGPSASIPIPAGPGPAGPAPAGPVPPSPSATGGGAAPGHSSPTGGTSGPAHAPGTNTPQHRPAAGIQPTFTGGPGAAPGTPPAYAPGSTAPAPGTAPATGNERSPQTAGNSASIAQAPPCGAGPEGPSRNGPGAAAYDGSVTASSTPSEGAAPSGSESAGTTGAGGPGPGHIGCGTPPHTESDPGAPGGSQNQARTGPETAGLDAPVVRAPAASGSTTAPPGPVAVPYSPDPSIRTPAGHADPVVHPPLPGEREPLGPAGTGPNGSTAEGHEHPGQRPVRLVPAGMPLPSTAGVPPSRPADPERASPDYLHAPNEALTASDPRVPPVLGEYTEAERAEHDDPGGGSR